MVTDDYYQPRLYLSNVSLPAVYSRWESALPEREAVEGEIIKEMGVLE